MFIRDWSNGPLLVRSDTGRLLRESDLASGGDAERYLAWNTQAKRPSPTIPPPAATMGRSELWRWMANTPSPPPAAL